MDTVATELIKISILGPILIALGTYCWKLHRENQDLQERLDEVHDKRTADAQQVQQVLLQLNDRWNQTFTAHIALMEAQKDIMAEVKEALRDMLRQRAR